ncbi:MAG: hypothetical protein E7656_06045 [Ruminococcaceae bacterium]|nr:hypothetical protein [Oscillospiraceae bacterium]
MIQSRPKLKGKKLIYTPLFLLIAAMLLFPASSVAGKYAAIVQLFAMCVAAYSLFILIKYVLSDYLYTIEDGHFTVHKINGKKSVCVADIELSDISGNLRTKEEYRKEDVARKLYKFIKNPDDERLRYIVCNFGTEECAILFEPDEYFEKQMMSLVSEWKQRKFEEEDEDDE